MILMPNVQEDSREEKLKLDQEIAFHIVSKRVCIRREELSDSSNTIFGKSVTVEVHLLTCSK